MTTEEYILLHRDDDVRRLALAAHDDGIDLSYALDQIAGWQTARQKIPAWAATEGLVYPPRLSMEQCSSEATARYKQHLAATLPGPHDAMTDLTGGLGVDFSFLATLYNTATYVERQPHLCRMARHNLPLLRLPHAAVVEAEATDALHSLPRQSLIYLDPARRDSHGQRTFAIADCTPDVTQLLPELLAKADTVLLKLSPMLDWHKATADLEGHVAQVHIVALRGECKELLLVLHPDTTADPTVTCANIQPTDTDGYTWNTYTLPASDTALPPVVSTADISDYCYLYEPDAAVMKAGSFGHLCRTFGVRQMAPNSHLFLSPTPVAGFPGRAFRILATGTTNKRSQRDLLQGISAANITTRNFPLTAAQLRQRLRLNDGGPHYLFATTDHQARHLLLLTEKA